VIAPEVREVIERSARLHHGLAFVHLGPLECVALMLGVHPRLVEQARACLDRPDERTLLIRTYVSAAERAGREPRASASPGAMPAPKGPEELILHAERHALGIEFLIRAPLETAAVIFAAHPDAVSAAREILARRGIAPERPPEP